MQTKKKLNNNFLNYSAGSRLITSALYRHRNFEQHKSCKICIVGNNYLKLLTTEIQIVRFDYEIILSKTKIGISSLLNVFFFEDNPRADQTWKMHIIKQQISTFLSFLQSDKYDSKRWYYVNIFSILSSCRLLSRLKWFPPKFYFLT